MGKDGYLCHGSGVTKQMCWGLFLTAEFAAGSRGSNLYRTGGEASGQLCPKLGVGNEGRECLHPGSLVEAKSIKDLAP